MVVVMVGVVGWMGERGWVQPAGGRRSAARRLAARHAHHLRPRSSVHARRARRLVSPLGLQHPRRRAGHLQRRRDSAGRCLSARAGKGWLTAATITSMQVAQASQQHALRGQTLLGRARTSDMPRSSRRKSSSLSKMRLMKASPRTWRASSAGQRLRRQGGGHWGNACTPCARAVPSRALRVNATVALYWISKTSA